MIYLIMLWADTMDIPQLKMYLGFLWISHRTSKDVVCFYHNFIFFLRLDCSLQLPVPVKYNRHWVYPPSFLFLVLILFSINPNKNNMLLFQSINIGVSQ